MERCPRCHATRYFYSFRCRLRATTIRVECEKCGYTGKEVPMKHHNDNAAAFAAADAWNKSAKALAADTPPPTLH